MAKTKKTQIDDRTVTADELEQVDRANKSGNTPVVFVHGLWLLPSSWDRWAKVFEQAGFSALSPGWPDDPDTVADAKKHPEVFARKSIGDIADHYEAIVRKLDKKPAIVGHSFGGLLTQILAGRGRAAVSVAIDPAPFPWRAAATDLLTAGIVSGVEEPGQPTSRGAAHVRPVPLRVRQRRE
jgi:pimeloyl-ACP methyl ester carboxylesterase